MSARLLLIFLVISQFMLFNPLFCSSSKDPGSAEHLRIDQLNKYSETVVFSNPEEAFIKASGAVKESEIINYSSGAATSQELLGTIFLHQGVYSEALKHFELAEKYYRGDGNQSKIAESISKKGLIYYNIKNPHEALKSHLEALSIYEKIGDRKGLAYAWLWMEKLIQHLLRLPS
jgi:tetratricopeptide (TPR) repeat protein